MGKAYYVQHDFFQARQNFEYLIRQFPNDKTKHEAMIWLARTHTESHKYKDAKEMLDLIDAERELPKKLKGDFAAAYADYFLKQKMYDDAIPKLKLAIKYTKKKANRVRYTYILAQVYEKVENLSKASETYDMVAKMNPPYEMEFNARINMARNYTGNGNAKEVKKKLRKMLRDDKNIEYQDQIYYAIAEIENREGNIGEAIKNYKLSSEKSLFNDFQKSISCMKLGEIYYAEEQYINAQIYYDSCMTFLPYDYENYKEIQSLSRNLNELAIYLTTIQFEDSVQMVAQMPEKERNQLIDNLIAQVIEEERQQQELERQQQQNSMLFDQRRGSNQDVNAPQGGSWYFYNPAQLSFGQNEFRKKWGNRKNEDNWRRKNKAVLSDFEDGMADNDSLGNDSTRVSKISDNKTREYYLQDLPINDSLMAQSNLRILEALYQAGRIYKERFEAYPESAEMFEELNTRYPKNDYLLLSYYSLYQINQLLKKDSEANTYKNLIISKFPDTHYAKLLNNPNYLKELEAKLNADMNFYMTTYDAYARDECNTVKTNAQDYLSREDPEEELVSKFDFLHVLCIGKTMDTTSFKHELVRFMEDYPNDELSNTAQNILAYFGNTNIDLLKAELANRPDVTHSERIGHRTDSTANENVLPEDIFTFDENAPHYYIIYVNTDKVDVKRVSFEVRNFNIFTFNLRTFNVVSIMYNDKYEMITVRTFDNQRQSLNYKKMISNNPDVFGRINENDYLHFCISEDNYQSLKKNKNIDAYLQFYLKYYENK
jgi:TolA-binding protein